LVGQLWSTAEENFIKNFIGGTRVTLIKTERKTAACSAFIPPLSLVPETLTFGGLSQFESLSPESLTSAQSFCLRVFGALHLRRHRGFFLGDLSCAQE
jgi:hypothetical protein